MSKSARRESALGVPGPAFPGMVILWFACVAMMPLSNASQAAQPESMPQGGGAVRLVPSHALAKILLDSKPEVQGEGVLRVEGAGGETVSAQAVLLTGDASGKAVAAMSDLRLAGSGAVIPGGAVQLRWERYMHIKANTQGIPADELIARAPVSIPDSFWESDQVVVEGGSPQPLWIEVDVPADAAPGEYRGVLSAAVGGRACELPVSVRVRGFRLPEARHQKVIQWWDFPGRGFEQLKPGSAEYWAHLERCCQFVKRYRQTDVRVGWELLTRQKKAEGATAWDALPFERFVDVVLKSGLRAVQFTGMGRHTKFQLEQDSRTEAVEDSLGRLAAVQEVVKRRGWQGRVLTSLADEPFIYHEQSYQALLARCRQVAPDVGVIEAVETDDIGELDIFVPKLSHLNLWMPRYQELRRQGKEVWFYTCCHPVGRYPNRFLDQPLIKARELHWISYLYGLDGFLHWGLNWFRSTGDPYSEDAANVGSLPPGDSQVAYPGKNGLVGSLRLSAMRDGLQDYEYLRLLEDRLGELKTRLGQEGRWLDPRQRSLELCRRVVQSCYEHTREPLVLMNARSAIADEIEALGQSPLLLVQTMPPEGTITPAGPTMINVRGVTTPGSKVTVNGRVVIPQNISPSGCFIDVQFITAGKTEITVTAEFEGRTRSVDRTFSFVE